MAKTVTAKPILKKFKVLSGLHRVDGKNLKKGQIVKSEKALDKIYMNKFRRVRDDDDDEEVVPKKKLKRG